MLKSVLRVLVVDDYEPFLRFVTSELGKQTRFQIASEVSDGLEAVRIAGALQPDLILLDIGLPKLNGIEAARRIREHSPRSIILFLSENRSADIVEEALRTGALGYVLKSDSAKELLIAVEAVLNGERFVSSSVSGQHVTHRAEHTEDLAARNKPAPTDIVGRHELVLYSEDSYLVDTVSQFLGGALHAGSAAVVVATAPHRDGLMQRLHADGLDMAANIAQGRFISMDAADTFSPCIVNGMLERDRFWKASASSFSKQQMLPEATIHELRSSGNVRSSCANKATSRPRFRTKNSAPEYARQTL